MPVNDIEFSADGTTMLLAEQGFNSSIPLPIAHQSRLLEYDGSTGNWILDTGNDPENCKHRIGFGIGANSRGGTDFAYAGTDGGCTLSDESHIVVTGDAFAGTSCFEVGCYYGLQYMDLSTSGSREDAILLDMDRDPASQAKAIYGDVDVFLGCSENEVSCSLIATNPQCICGIDGEIEVVAVGGSGNFEYSIDGGLTFQTTNTFGSLPVGDYIVTIRNTDTPECTNSCMATLVDPQVPNCFGITFSRNN